MAIKTKYLIGERFKNNDGFGYEIIGYCESNRKRKVKFDSGYETILSTNSIIKGNMKDFGRATVFGVGIIGFKNASNQRKNTPKSYRKYREEWSADHRRMLKRFERQMW